MTFIINGGKQSQGEKNNMNGYQTLADSYKILIERQEISKEDGEAEIRVLEFLATCSKDDIYRMVNSTAFNDVIVNFCKKALDLSNISDDDKSKVIDEIYECFSRYSCKDICEQYQ